MSSSIRVSEVDRAKLVALYWSSDWARNIIDRKLMKVSSRDERVTKVETLLHTGRQFKRWQHVEGMKFIAQTGVADFIPARREYPTRLEWRPGVDWESIAELIKNGPTAATAAANEAGSDVADEDEADEDGVDETVTEILQDCEARLERITGCKMHVMLLPIAPQAS